MTTTMLPAIRKAGLAVGSVLILGLAWWLLVHLAGSPFLPGPVEVLAEALELISTGQFAAATSVTLRRLLFGLLFAVCLGFPAGMLMGRSKAIEAAARPMITLGLMVPALTWGIVTTILFGLREIAPVLSIVGIVAPLVAVNAWKGMLALPVQLLEMTAVFRLPRLRVLRVLIIPSLLPFLLAAIRLGFSLAWKVALIIEIFGFSDGVGYRIYEQFALFSISGALAWTFLFVLIALVVEYGCLGVLEAALLKWRPHD